MRNSLAILLLVVGLLPAHGAFVINEVDPDTLNRSGAVDYLEFVELKGSPNEVASNLVIVYFNGDATNAVSYRAWDLNGKVADANGYLLIGTADIATRLGVPNDAQHNANVVQNNSQEAVALYSGTIGEWPNGTAPKAGALDFFVYYNSAFATNPPATDWSAFSSNITVMDEGAYGEARYDGFARYPDGGSTWYLVQSQTPRAANTDPFTFSVPSTVNFKRMNQRTAAPTTATVTFNNDGGVPLTINSISLDALSNSAFSLESVPTLPTTLTPRQTTSVIVQLNDPAPTSNKVYSGQINYTTDNPTSASGFIALNGELVVSSQTAPVGSVRINEINYAGTGGDWNGDGMTASQNDEFIELYNPTNAAINIEGWDFATLRGDHLDPNGWVFPLGATIPAKGFVVAFAGGIGVGFTPGTSFDYDTARFHNGGSHVMITDGTKSIDAVAYGDAEDDPQTDEYLNMGTPGTPLTVSSGSIGRRPDGEDTFMAFSSTSTDLPTPAASNNLASVTDWQLF